MNVDWDKLRIFLAVVDAGSFTRAGKAINLSQSAVSRQIAALEECLKVSLFHRHARGLVLTEQGEEFQRTVKDMSSTLAMATARINESREQPEGPLKITTTVAFGSGWLTARMNKFLTLYPEIAVSLVLADTEELDLSLRQADVAIRFARQSQPTLVQRHLMSIRYHVFATAEYLGEHGTPNTAQELNGHQIIVYGDEKGMPVDDMNWLLEIGMPAGEKREPALRVNSVYGIHRAVLSGLGLAALPYYLSDEAPELVEILADLEGPGFDAYFVYPEELRHSKRIAVVRDFLVDEVEEQNLQMRRERLRAI